MSCKLCYVEGSFAYFTTQDLKDQWGDDWNDTPWEHNAGTPYHPSKSYSYLDRETNKWKDGSDYTDGKPNWQIRKVAFDGWWDLPGENMCNSPYSVQDINSGAAAWLYNSCKKISIMAGVSIDEFKRLIKEGDGDVYTQEE